MNDLGSIRLQICERANLMSLAIQAGFRPVNGRARSLHCIHGEDKTPSAHLYRSRVKCFGCNGSWSAIDLLMLIHGCEYVQALKIGATDLCIPWEELRPADRERIQTNQQLAARIASEAADWAHGLHLVMQARKSRLINAAEWLWGIGGQALGDKVAAMVGEIPRAALSPETADPALIVRSYRSAAVSHPEETRRVLAAGREDRENAHRTTSAIVSMLAAATNTITVETGATA